MKSLVRVSSKEPFLARFYCRIKRLRVCARAARTIGPCHLWQGATTSKGYGNIMLNGKTIGAHVVALEQKLGRKLRPGYQALHKCVGTRNCVRQSHLYEGTPWQNAQDRERARAERHKEAA